MASSSELAVRVREKYEPVIGLEVHVQLLTQTKIFCGCSTQFGAPANTNVCPVCLGLPGALPVLNKKAVEYAVLAAMALNCRINEPDIRSPEEAYEYLTLLKEIILYTGVSDCNMEEGSLRCDANVSIRPRGQKQFGTKTEVKNVNSFRFIRQALEYEIERQAEVLENGGRIAQETRLYNSSEGKTYGMRSKEQAHDYRYFPEPDLLPLVVDEKWQAEIRATLPELPEARRKRLIADYGISAQDAHVLTLTKSMANQF